MTRLNSASLATATRLGARAQRWARLSAVTVLLLGFGSAMAQLAATPAAEPAQPAVAQPVSVRLTQFKVIKGATGAEQLIDAATVKPGDTLEYRATYTNTTDSAVTGLLATLPIPEGLEYQPASAKPGAGLAQAAAQDGVFAPEPLMRQVNGVAVPVPYADYRALRWNLGRLPARGVSDVSVRAQVSMYVPPVVPVVPAAPAAKP